MASKQIKQLPHERRKGEAALSDFAEYVEQQQALRYPSSARAAATSTATTIADVGSDHHEELDDILDSLDLSDPAPRVRLRDLLLASSDDTGAFQRLVDILQEKLRESHGEAVFEVGFENNGDCMKLTKEDWAVALKRIEDAAKKLNAACRVLLTKNVGGEFDGVPLVRVSRPESSAPSVGSHSRHVEEQAELMSQAFA